MGRSGGGGHRGGGGGHRPRTNPRPRPRPHTHNNVNRRRDRSHRVGGRGAELSPQVSLVVMGVFILVIFIIVIVVVAVDVSGSSGPSEDIVLSPKEQYLWCGMDKIKAKYKSDKIKVYESRNGVPRVTEETRELSSTLSGHLSNSYKYKSFFLPPGSYLTAHKTSPTATFILIRGWNAMQSFIDGRSYSYIHRDTEDDFDFNSTEFGEYFIVVDSKFSTTFSAEVHALITTYDTKGLSAQCTSRKSECTLNEDKNRDYCVVFDYDVESEQNFGVDISIQKKEGSGINTGSIIVIALGVFFILILIVGMIRSFKDLKNGSSYEAELEGGGGATISRM